MLFFKTKKIAVFFQSMNSVWYGTIEEVYDDEVLVRLESGGVINAPKDFCVDADEAEKMALIYTDIHQKLNHLRFTK